MYLEKICSDFCGRRDLVVYIVVFLVLSMMSCRAGTQGIPIEGEMYIQAKVQKVYALELY